jgi:electron transfer flavoprotein alpha subunit
VTVLCLVEHADGEVADASLRALTFARLLAGPGDGIAAAAFGITESDPAVPDEESAGAVSGISASKAALDAESAGAVSGISASKAALDPESAGAVSGISASKAALDALAGYGVCDTYLVESPQFTGYAPQAWARALAGLAGELPAAAVVAAGTDRGNEVMAHLGAITGLPMAANCAAAAADGAGRWRLTRHRWAGSLLEDAVLEAPVALLTVAPDAVAAEPTQEPSTVSVRRCEPALEPADLLVRAVESAARSGGVSLATARVVVGGGRGVGGPDGFGALEELAGLLGGVVGVSRVVTSEGWRPHKQQVGQTGTRISPELYLACGISGAIQHMAGCLSAKHIVAVNTDADAPILAHADYAVIGDLNQVIPALITAIRARNGPP